MRRSSAAGILALLATVSACASAPATVPSSRPDPTGPSTTEPAPTATAPEPTPEAAPPTQVQIEGYTPEIARVLASRSAWYRSAQTRIALARRGAVRLYPDDVDRGLADHTAFADPKPLSVVEDGERPRVVTDDREIRLLLHVDRADAQPVVIANAPLQRDPAVPPGSPPQRGHVVLLSGAWVEIGARQGDMLEVTYRRDDDTAFTGWIPAAALGTTATTGQPTMAASSEAPGFVTRRKTRLSVTPGGKALAKLDEQQGVIALTTRARDGHLLVEYRPPCADEYLYVGWVPERDLFQPNYGMGHGCGYGGAEPRESWGDLENAPRVRVEAGRFLLAPDRPSIVGCVIQPTELADLGDGRHAVATIWGPVQVRLAPEGFGGACGTER